MTSSPLSCNIGNWDHELSNDSDRDFIISGLKEGFKIMDFPSVPLTRVECENYTSATCAQNKSRVEQQIREEISAGHYRICDSKPWIVSALGAVPK